MQIKSYVLEDIQIDYLFGEHDKVSMQIFPKGKNSERKKPWEREKPAFNARAKYIPGWNIGNLAYVHFVGENLEKPGSTMKNENMGLCFESQTYEEQGNEKSITTILAKAGYRIRHKITSVTGRKGLKCETTFINQSGEDVTLDMLSSFALDNLSPFQMDDAPNAYQFHRFYGGWSMEGKHISQSVEELSLEKSWAGFFGSTQRFGSKGSYPVKRYFPTAVFEDKTQNVMWAVQLAHNATWQMELSRMNDTFSFTGGLGDREFCGWKKVVKSGESFDAPVAYLATVEGDIYDACHAVTDMQKIAQEAYGEQGIPVSFNEYCASWGHPTQTKMLSYCNILKNYGVKYLVIDAGWCQEGHEQDSNGEWGVDKNIFPDMKEMNRIIRENGMVPGIWFEFEVTTEGSKMFEPEYDFMHLKKDGVVLKTGNWRSYWDFRRKDVQDYVYEKVIQFLKDNDFGYIKVDYNGNIGMEVDGAESGAEGLREHLQCVKEFFARMKKEISDLVIENCASGGHRLEPSMMGLAAVSSFSDAHECIEIPYVAANLHNLMLPSQELIWAVLHEDDSRERLVYSLAATFLGRVCLSGSIDSLADWQKEIIAQALEFYDKLEDVIKNGKTKIYGNRSDCMRYPQGVQAVVRQTDTEALLVYHAYEDDLKDVEIPLTEGFTIGDQFFADNVSLNEGALKITDCKPFTAGAVLLKRK